MKDQFENYLNTHEAFAHSLNPSHICDYPENTEEEIEEETEEVNSVEKNDSSTNEESVM